MPNFSSRKHITVFTTSWEVCEPNYSSYIIVKHSTQVPSLLVRGRHFIYLLQLVVVFFFLSDFCLALCGLSKLFIFWTRKQIYFLWYAFNWWYQRTSRRMWYRFQVMCRSQFSRINVSIKWKYNFKFLFKSVYQITLSFSFLANVYFTDQWSSESQVFFCLNHNRADLIFKLVYIQISSKKIYSSPTSVNTLLKGTTGLSH